MLEFLKKNYKSILIGLFCLFILYWVIYVLTPALKMGEEARFEIRELNNKIEEIMVKQEKLETDIKKYETKIKETNYNIQKIKDIKIKVGNDYGKKINSVNRYTNSELTGFFTERYSKYY